MSKQKSFEKVAECLYRNPTSGTYYARLKVRGKQIRRSLRTKYLPEAKRKLRDFRTDQEKVDPFAESLSVAALCDRYRATISHLAPKTIRRKHDILTKIQDHWKTTDIRKVRKSEVAAWLSSFDFGAPSYNLYLECIRSAFRLAVDDRIIPSSPVEGIKYKKPSRPIRPTPTREEFRAIVANIRQQEFAAAPDESADLVAFYGLSGLGLHEVNELTWGDIDFKQKRITPYRQKTKKGFYLPIFPQLLPLLKNRYDQAKEANKGRRPAREEKVFKIADAKKALSAACRRLKFPQYSSRAFRRMFITNALENGVDVKVISEWQAHIDGGKLILNTYSHVRAKHSNEMAKLMK